MATDCELTTTAYVYGFVTLFVDSDTFALDTTYAIVELYLAVNIKAFVNDYNTFNVQVSFDIKVILDKNLTIPTNVNTAFSLECSKHYNLSSLIIAILGKCEFGTFHHINSTFAVDVVGTNLTGNVYITAIQLNLAISSGQDISLFTALILTLLSCVRIIKRRTSFRNLRLRAYRWEIRCRTRHCPCSGFAVKCNTVSLRARIVTYRD